MHAMASERLKEEIKAGQVQLSVGEASSLALPSESIDKVYHMNVCYFFEPLDATLLEIKRVMKPSMPSWPCRSQSGLV